LGHYKTLFNQSITSGIEKDISDTVSYNKRENYNERRKELKLNVYVLADMVVTRDTAHFERSLLNIDALLNAVQIIQ